MYKLVLLRHGESIWNKENRFTGWTDVDLTKKGIKEAKDAGKLLKEAGYSFDIAYTSYLKKAIRTLWLILDEMDLMWIPVMKTWRLNERHYGALQGQNKAETAKECGEKQCHLWRRSWDIRPPALNKSDKRYPGNDPKYKDLGEKELPLTESLKDTYLRLIPFWLNTITPIIELKKKVLIIAHGNSLRSLIKYIDKIPDEKIIDLNIPTGTPLVYELDKKLKPIGHYYLGDINKIKKAIKIMAEQRKIEN